MNRVGRVLLSFAEKVQQYSRAKGFTNINVCACYSRLPACGQLQFHHQRPCSVTPCHGPLQQTWPIHQFRYSSTMAEGEKKHLVSNPDELFEYFKNLDITYNNVDHPEVFTVETMMPYLKDMPGKHTKNLFLKDKKKRFYLLTVRHDREIKLNDIAKLVGATGGLRFADEAILIEKLGVGQGCVTAYAIVNDQEANIKLLIDSDLVADDEDYISGHPMSNAKTASLKVADFKRFLAATKHEPTLVKFE